MVTNDVKHSGTIIVECGAKCVIMDAYRSKHFQISMHTLYD